MESEYLKTLRSKADECLTCTRAKKCNDLKTRPKDQRTIYCVRYIPRKETL